MPELDSKTDHEVVGETIDFLKATLQFEINLYLKLVDNLPESLEELGNEISHSGRKIDFALFTPECINELMAFMEVSYEEGFGNHFGMWKSLRQRNRRPPHEAWVRLINHPEIRASGAIRDWFLAGNVDWSLIGPEDKSILERRDIDPDTWHDTFAKVISRDDMREYIKEKDFWAYPLLGVTKEHPACPNIVPIEQQESLRKYADEIRVSRYQEEGARIRAAWESDPLRTEKFLISLVADPDAAGSNTEELRVKYLQDIYPKPFAQDDPKL